MSKKGTIAWINISSCTQQNNDLSINLKCVNTIYFIQGPLDFHNFSRCIYFNLKRNSFVLYPYGISTFFKVEDLLEMYGKKWVEMKIFCLYPR